MAPVRRYLRISAYSVLEVRIYLDNPADAHRWLLHSSHPALPNIIKAVRPFVLPKLREENEKRKKGGKKKSVKDTVVSDDFECSIFLTDLSTPHALLTRAKIFGNPKNGQSGSKTEPLDVDEDNTDEGAVIPILRREQSDEAVDVNMNDIPIEGAEDTLANNPVELSEDEDEPTFQTQEVYRSTTARRAAARRQDDVGGAAYDGDDKKKLGFRTNYEGFRIHGHILCLVVKRKTTKRGQMAADNTGQAMLENWIVSTQENLGMLAD